MESSTRRSNGVERGGKNTTSNGFRILKVRQETGSKAASLLIFKTGMGNDVLLTLPLGRVHPLASTIHDRRQIFIKYNNNNNCGEASSLRDP